MAMAAVSAPAKPKPAFKPRGNTTKNTSDGRIISRILRDRLMTLSVLPVSTKSQTIASSDVSGSEASSPASSGERLATSETATTMSAVMTVLMAR